MKSFEVKHVANGYLVHLGEDIRSNRGFSTADLHVFATWTDASKWLRDQFECEQGADKK